MLEADPGRVLLHRLNGDDLERTPQALLASELPVKDSLPMSVISNLFSSLARVSLR